MLATRVIVLSKRPAKIVKEIPLHFTRDFVENGSGRAKYTEEYYEIREELLNIIGQRQEGEEDGRQ